MFTTKIKSQKMVHSSQLPVMVHSYGTRQGSSEAQLLFPLLMSHSLSEPTLLLISVWLENFSYRHSMNKITYKVHPFRIYSSLPKTKHTLWKQTKLGPPLRCFLLSSLLLSSPLKFLPFHLRLLVFLLKSVALFFSLHILIFIFMLKASLAAFPTIYH